ncbi:MAG: FAD-dependent oxidoreductase [Gammaproteobacteria bacterium]
MPRQITDKRVAIVGGGIAGLTAALRLSERGYKVTLFERSQELGGMLGANNGRILFTIEPGKDVGPDVRRSIEPVCKELDACELPEAVRKRFADKGIELPESAHVGVIRPQVKWRVAYYDGQREHMYFIVRRERHADAEIRAGLPVPDAELVDVDESRESLHVYNGAYYEHCFHMYLNWYHNFWQIVEEDLGLDRTDLFHRRPSVKYLQPGTFPNYTELTDVGAPGTMLKNLVSGVAAPHDMYLYGYSLVDLLSTPIRSDWLGMFTVNGFMRSRWYGTDGSAILHQDTLAKAFSIPSFLTAAHAYKKFIHFGTPVPSPMLWLMKGNVQTHLIYPIEDVLRQRGCTIMRGASVEGWELEETGNEEQAETRVRKVKWKYAPWGRAECDGPQFEHETDFVILAVQIETLRDLLAEPSEGDIKPLMEIEPHLHGVRQLQSASMASLDLYFTKRLENIPAANVVLENSHYNVTFVDNSQNWSAQSDQIGARTMLNVSASNIHQLPTFVDMEDPAHQEIVMQAMITELARYVKGFDPGTKHGESKDIDWNLTNLRMNLDQPLMLNQVGSGRLRPRHRYDSLPNLFFAGDPTHNIIEVVTIEGAVLTGVRAAMDVYEADPLGDPIKVKVPYHYPPHMFLLLKILGFPAAMVAKGCAMMDEVASLRRGDADLEKVSESQQAIVSAPFQLMQRVFETVWTGYIVSLREGLQRARGARAAARPTVLPSQAEP